VQTGPLPPLPPLPIIPEADSVVLLGVGLALVGGLAAWRARRRDE